MDLNRLKNTYFVLGLILLGILVLIVILMRVEILHLSWGAEPLVSAIFGWGGIILIIIGVLKAIFSKKK